MSVRGRVAAALLLMVGGCGEPPAMEVGRIGYPAAAISGLGAEDLELLADLTAFGLAVADRRLTELAAPFVDRDVRSLLLQRTAMELAARSTGLDEARLRAAYERDPEPELVVRHLVVISERWRPPAHRDSARARAREALDRIRAGEPFEEVVGEYSDEPGAAERGGLLQPGRRDSWVPEFWRAASALGEGEVSDVAETEYGYHVLRLEERRSVPFEEARDQVLERLVDLPEAFRHSSRWVEDRAGDAAVDTGAVAAWQAGRDPGRPLVHWPGTDLDPYTAEDLDRYVTTMSPATLADWRRRPTAEVVPLIEGLARNSFMLRQAAAMGLDVTEAQRAAVAGTWRERAEGWARALGFAPRMQDRSLRAQALAGVATYGQDALLARTEVRRLSVRLRQLYPVTLPEAPSP